MNNIKYYYFSDATVFDCYCCGNPISCAGYFYKGGMICDVCATNHQMVEKQDDDGLV